MLVFNIQIGDLSDAERAREREGGGCEWKGHMSSNIYFWFCTKYIQIFTNVFQFKATIFCLSN